VIPELLRKTVYKDCFLFIDLLGVCRMIMSKKCHLHPLKFGALRIRGIKSRLVNSSDVSLSTQDNLRGIIESRLDSVSNVCLEYSGYLVSRADKGCNHSGTVMSRYRRPTGVVTAII